MNNNLWAKVGSIDLPLKITLNDVLTVVCECLNVNINDVKGKKGTDDLVSARKMYGYFSAKYVPKAPMIAIGHAIGKDHSTVHFYKEAVQNMMFTKDKKYVGSIECIDDKLIQMKWSNQYYTRNPETVEINSL